MARPVVCCLWLLGCGRVVAQNLTGIRKLAKYCMKVLFWLLMVRGSVPPSLDWGVSQKTKRKKRKGWKLSQFVRVVPGSVVSFFSYSLFRKADDLTGPEQRTHTHTPGNL